MDVDPVSEILRITQAQALLTGGFTAGGRWAIRFPARDKIKFFAVLRGACDVRLEGEAETGRIEAGDVGLLSVPRSFVLASDPDAASLDAPPLDAPPLEAMALFSAAGRSHVTLGDGADFAYVGGHVELDPRSAGLLADVLPPWIHVRASSPQAAALRWLVDRLVAEQAAPQPGGQLAAAQLTQLLFIEILRAHLGDASPMPAGWLRTLADRRVAPALRLMHADPARAWHLEDLADACGMSRTSFAFHFRTLCGVAPLAYLTAWRMRLAQQALRDATPVAVVAQSLGYGSESAFSTAFKRETGVSPRGYRRAVRAGEGTRYPLP